MIYRVFYFIYILRALRHSQGIVCAFLFYRFGL